MLSLLKENVQLGDEIRKCELGGACIKHGDAFEVGENLI
jgi:hypothetical protein